MTACALNAFVFQKVSENTADVRASFLSCYGHCRASLRGETNFTIMTSTTLSSMISPSPGSSPRKQPQLPKPEQVRRRRRRREQENNLIGPSPMLLAPG